MSVQICQYVIFGIKLPFSFEKKWEKVTGNIFYETFEKHLDDNAFKPKWPEKDGVGILYDGMNGDWIFAGKVFAKAKDGDYLGEKPFMIPDITEGERQEIAIKVDKLFSPISTLIIGPLQFYVVTQYR